MNEKELQKYIETLNRAEAAIGYRKANRKDLARLEMIKQLLDANYYGLIPKEFIRCEDEW